MDRSAYARVKELYHEARDIPASEVGAWLEAQGDADEIRHAVLGMLGQAQAESSFLAESPAAELPLPETIGRYRILGLMGRGGMGTVYRAEQDSPRREVALKMIHESLLAPELVRRFELEGEFQARLNHPGIARIYESGLADTGRGPQPFIAMEMVEGRSLDVAATGATVPERLRLVASISDAVEHAHQQGVIHRDLKPANVIVKEDGQPVILDFGIARTVDMSRTMATRTGELIGTLPYMSPEQVGGDPHAIDTRTDVYALGVILFELLTDRLPIKPGDESLYETVRRIREENPPRLSSLDRTFTGDLDVIARVAMEKDKERRYGSARALADDLRRFLEHQPIAARPPSTMYEIGKLVRRHRVAAAALAMALVSLVVGFGIALREISAKNDALSRETQARQEQSRERARAERGFDSMRELVREGLFEVYYEIDDKPGTDRACEMLLETANAYLEVVEREAPPTPALLRELSRGYAESADASFRFKGSEPAVAEQAIATMRRSLAYLDRIIEAGDHEPPDFVNYARGLHLIAQIHRSRSRPTEALAVLEAVRSRARQAEAAGGMPRFFGLRTRIRARILEAQIHIEAREAPEAANALDRVTALTATIRDVAREVEAEPDLLASTEMRTWLQVGSFAAQTKDYERSITAYRQAQELTLELLRAEPTNANRARNVLGAARSVAWAARRLQRPGEAITAIEETRKTLASFFALQTDAPRVDLELGYCLRIKARSLEDLGREADASAAWRSVLELAQRALERHPEDRRFLGLRKSAEEALASPGGG